MTESITKRNKNWFLAGILAWIIPGLGHIYVNRKARGMIIFVTLTITFWFGVALGGTMTADRIYQPMWTYSQTLTGVYGAATYYRQHDVYKKLSRNKELVEAVRNDPGSYPRTELIDNDNAVRILPSRGGRPDALQMKIDSILSKQGIAVAYPTATVARAFAGIAGLLNLLCIFDVIMLCLMNAPGDNEKDQSKECSETLEQESANDANNQADSDQDSEKSESNSQLEVTAEISTENEDTQAESSEAKESDQEGK